MSTQPDEGSDIDLRGMSSCFLCGRVVLAVRAQTHDGRAAVLYNVGRQILTLHRSESGEPEIRERTQIVEHSCYYNSWRKTLKREKWYLKKGARQKIKDPYSGDVIRKGVLFPSLDSKAQEIMSQSVGVVCPRCMAQIGTPCINLNDRTKSTKQHHKERIFQGFTAQRLRVVFDKRTRTRVIVPMNDEQVPEKEQDADHE